MAVSKQFHSVNKHNNIQNYQQSCLYTLLGLVTILILFLYIILNSPLYLYRWIVIKYIAPKFHPTRGKAVTNLSHYMTTEFIPESFPSPSSTDQKVLLPPTRYAIVTCATFPGTITLQEMSDAITKGWLTPKKGQTELKFPEFQQYLEMWMGIMFWSQDEKFSLENHVFVHTMPDADSRNNSEKYYCDLVETLVNKRFIFKRSPWEVHLLQNYRESISSQSDGMDSNKNEQQSKSNESVNTVIMFRHHHGMADGVSALNAFLDGLLGINYFDAKVATPKNVDVKVEKIGDYSAIVSNAKKWIYTIWRTIYDAGYLLSLHKPFQKYSSIPWYAPDSKKKWKQLYGRSKLISVNKIKFVKNQLGASFTGVLMSCLEAGTAKNMKQKGFSDLERIPIFSLVPLPNHSRKLQNHATGTVLNLDLNETENDNLAERLQKIDQKFMEARHFSQLPIIITALGTLYSLTLAPLAKSFCSNRFVPAALSNFPGPGVEVKFLDRDMKAIDFCVAGLAGVTGVVFGIISYNGHIRLTVTAENGVMEREEVKTLISDIEMEVDELYIRSKKIEKL